MMPKFRAVQVHRSCGSKCLEETVDGKLFRRYSQEDRFRYWDTARRRRRVRNHDAPKDSIRVSSPLAQGIMKTVIPCSSSSICWVQNFLPLALKTETSMSHEREEVESLLESKNKPKWHFKSSLPTPIWKPNKIVALLNRPGYNKHELKRKNIM